MRQAINKLLGRKATPSIKAPAAATPVSRSERAADSRDNPHTIEDNSDNATRRQLIQMMLRDGLRKHGIPPGWVECRILVVNSRSRGPGLYLSLVMRQWDMLLLTYAHAFQQQLRAAITEFEPQAPVWLHGISWEFDVGDSCPYRDMPDPSIWRELLASDKPAARAAVSAPPAASPPVTAAVPAPVPAAVPTQAAPGPAPEAPAGEEDLDVLRDLERMFAIRDADIKQQAFADTAPVDFQNTEPSQRS